MVLVSFTSTYEALARLSTVMASTVKWELVLTNTSSSNPMPTALGPHPFTEPVKDLNSLTEGLVRSGCVKDYVAVAGYVLTVSGCSGGRCGLLQALNGTEFLVIEGAGIESYVALPARFLQSPADALRILNLKVGEVNATFLERVEDVLSYVGPGYVQSNMRGYAFRYSRQVPPLVLVAPPGRASAALEDAVHAFLNASRECGCVVKAYYVAPTAVVDLDPGKYVNPASVTATYRNILEVGRELGKEVGVTRHYMTFEDGNLLTYSYVERGARFAVLFTLSLPLLIVALTTQYIVDSAVLTSRKALGLLRLRGLKPSKLKAWMAELAVVGGGAGVLASYVITALAWPSHTSAAEVLADPYVAAVAFASSGLMLAYASARSYRTAMQLLPREAIKTELAPEDLLSPMKVGVWGWVSLGVSALFIGEGLTGFSAQAYLISNPTSQLPTSALIGLVILSLIELVLRPFTPIFLAFGAGKAAGVHLEALIGRVWEAFGGYVGLTSKAVTSLLKRRTASIVMLAVFSVTILTQALGSAAYTQTLFSTAAQASVGSEYVAVKHLLLLNPSSAGRELNEFLRSMQGFPGAAVAVIPLSEGGGRSLNALIIMNPDEFLKTTYWFREWGIEEGFADLVRKVEGGGEILIYGSGGPSRKMTLKTFPTETLVGEAVISGHVKGFPGAPNLGLRSGDVIAGPWLLEKVASVEGGGNASAPHLIWVTLAFFTRDGGVAEELRGEGFRVLSLEQLKSSPTYRLLKELTQYLSPSEVASGAITALSLVVAAAVAWAVGRESSRLHLLLRLRGVGRGDVV
ncbi:MAG: hypothetical protein J7L55_05210, partial [Desulfurococcales archaeon]|nr:hypothetical protein [Desulfurococcales archaeon]